MKGNAVLFDMGRGFLNNGRMKLSVSTYSFSRWRHDRHRSLDQTIDQIASMGVRGIEFAEIDGGDKRFPVRRAAVLRRRCERAGLAIAGYCVGADLYGTPERQQAEVATVKKHVDIAAALGARTMRHDVTYGPAPRAKRTSFNAVVANVAPPIREIADYAAACGVVTSLENHGFYMQKATRVESLLKKVDHPNFRLTIDMGNFLCVNDDPVAAVKRLAPYAVMAHVKDFHVRSKKTMPSHGWFATPTSIALRGAVVGHGDVDVPAQLRLLAAARYRGWLSLEFEGIEEPVAAVGWGLEYLKKTMRTIRRPPR